MPEKPAQFQDPWNPTQDEVRAWAYDAETFEPDQDWELSMSLDIHESVLLECAGDPNCPKQSFMLRVLYLNVGDAVRTGFKSTPREIVEGVLARADACPEPLIQLWLERSRELIAHPKQFKAAWWR
jgi:hypothetical protein